MKLVGVWEARHLLKLITSLTILLGSINTLTIAKEQMRKRSALEKSRIITTRARIEIIFFVVKYW